VQVSPRAWERIRDFAKRDGLTIAEALDRLTCFAIARLDCPLPSDRLTVDYSGHRAGYVCSFKARGFGPPSRALVDSIDRLLEKP
jgi:hypothetical protein